MITFFPLYDYNTKTRIHPSKPACELDRSQPNCQTGGILAAKKSAGNHCLSYSHHPERDAGRLAIHPPGAPTQKA